MLLKEAYVSTRLCVMFQPTWRAPYPGRGVHVGSREDPSEVTSTRTTPGHKSPPRQNYDSEHTARPKLSPSLDQNSHTYHDRTSYEDSPGKYEPSESPRARDSRNKQYADDGARKPLLDSQNKSPASIPSFAKKSHGPNKPRFPQKSSDFYQKVTDSNPNDPFKPIFAKTSKDSYKPGHSKMMTDSHKPNFAKQSEDSYQPRFAKTSEDSYKPSFAKTPEDPYKPSFAKKSEDSYGPRFAAPKTDGQYTPVFLTSTDDTYQPSFAKKSDDPYKPSFAQKSESDKSAFPWDTKRTTPHRRKLGNRVNDCTYCTLHLAVWPCYIYS